MIIISPSVLSMDFRELEKEVKECQELGIKLFHIDVMDGYFVPNMTFGTPLLEMLEKIDVKLDIHLMCQDNRRYFELFKRFKSEYMSFHIESERDKKETLSLINDIKSNGSKAGIALNPDTPLSEIEEFLPSLDFVLIMSVNAGFSNQKFREYVMDKLKELNRIKKENDFGFKIEIDGGISDENIDMIREIGIDMVVSGGYFFKDKRKAIETLGE